MTEPIGSFPGFAPQPEPQQHQSAAEADGFDRARVMRLIDQLERDIAAVEAAMAQVEAGEHDAFAATVAPLELRLVD